MVIENRCHVIDKITNIKRVDYHVNSALTLCMLGRKFSRPHLSIVVLFFSVNRI